MNPTIQEPVTDSIDSGAFNSNNLTYGDSEVLYSPSSGSFSYSTVDYQQEVEIPKKRINVEEVDNGYIVTVSNIYRSLSSISAPSQKFISSIEDLPKLIKRLTEKETLETNEQ